ncbi:MAG TPA: HdeD family acid-resistance protein [Gemmataceae bacterium]|jgi:uncharacterized membrane protein HdeD (DUF308 family)|nr:HdeD family acid-resistance protein [Gemmataceae bacterium]
MRLTNLASPGALANEEHVSLRAAWWMFLVMGVISIIVGMLAISAAFIATMASVVVFGVLLVVEGITGVIHAIMVRTWKGFAMNLLVAALYLLGGFFMLEEPIRAAEVLTLVLAAAFIVGGMLRVIIAIAVQFHGWPWVLLNGVIDLILGVMIWSGWPGTSLWVLGLFVGIDLLVHGWSCVILALAVRAHNIARPAAV